MEREPKTSTAQTQTDELVTDWRELEVELGWFGSKLEELRANSAGRNDTLVRDLEERYEDISHQVVELKDKSAAHMESSKDANDSGLSSAYETVKESTNELGTTISNTVESARDSVNSGAAKIGEHVSAQRDKIGQATSETGERAKLAAQDVGHGFGIAWQALKRDFQSAYDRLTEQQDGSNQDKKPDRSDG